MFQVYLSFSVNLGTRWFNFHKLYILTASLNSIWFAIISICSIPLAKEYFLLLILLLFKECWNPCCNLSRFKSKHDTIIEKQSNTLSDHLGSQNQVLPYLFIQTHSRHCTQIFNTWIQVTIVQQFLLQELCSTLKSIQRVSSLLCILVIRIVSEGKNKIIMKY